MRTVTYWATTNFVTREGIEDQALTTAKKFPGLSTVGFYAEVGWEAPRFYESDVKAIVLRMVYEGKLRISSDYKIFLPEED